MIRTLVEIQGGRVSIRETGDETTVTVTVDSAPSEVPDQSRGQIDGSWRDSLNKGQLLTEIERLEQELERRTRERDEREAARAVQERQAERFKAQAYGQNEWAAKERNRAERAEANGSRLSAALVQAEKDRDQALQSLAARDRLVGKVSSAVDSPIILSVLRTEWLNWTQSEAAALTEAVNEVRRIVGSPESETSQA